MNETTDTPGNVLRPERENQNLSLKDIAQKLKINVEYLKAIEDDNYSLLPAEVFTKAYLRIYAETLGLDSKHILTLYKNRQGEEPVIAAAAPGKTIDFAALKQRFITAFPWRPSMVLPFIAVLVIVAMVFMLREDKKPAVTKTVPEVTQALPEETQALPVVEREQSGHTPPEELQLKIIADEITWVSVSADNGTPREWLLRAGESVTVQAFEQFALKIGNAGGTMLLLNGKDVGSLGPHGKVVDIVLTDDRSRD